MRKGIAYSLIMTLMMTVFIQGKVAAGESSYTNTSEYSKAASDYSLDIDAGNKLFDLSDLMYGIFLEDINAACDGGLSAEMVENRSFEYGTKYGCKPDSKWETVGNAVCEIRDGLADGTALNENNPHYMVINNNSSGEAGIANIGFLDGMAVKEGQTYNFSVYAKGVDGYTGAVHADIMVDGYSAASETIDIVTGDWKKYELNLTPDTTASSEDSYKAVKLQLTIDNGSCAFDMVSLMSADNTLGFRTDLVNNLKELHPAFFRFPGGCVTEGTKTPEDAYNWKQSVGCDEAGEPIMFNGVYGDEAVRAIGENNDWNYYMSYDLGFYEYFLLCEYLNTLAVPVLNAGAGCEVRGASGAYTGEELQKYIQMALDLVEFCRGDENTKWGAVRISMGHNEPFEIKYIGIGNEQSSDEYFDNYAEFVKAFADAAEDNPEMYSDIKLCMSPIIGEGTGWLKSTVQKGYKYASNWLSANPEYTKEQWAAVYDHHNYSAPEWFFKNCDYYSPKNYSRTDTNGNYGGLFDVFVGEYAAHVEDNPNALLEALAEAAFMTSLEENGDIVKMACYAPLLCSVNKVNWKWNMIYFDNDEILNTTNYYAQKLFMNNMGSKQLESELDGAKTGSENDTEAEAYQSVNLAKNGDIIIKLVNVTGGEKTFAVSVQNAVNMKSQGTAYVLSGDDSNDKNVMGADDNMEIVTETVSGLKDEFNYTVPKFSITVLRIPTDDYEIPPVTPAPEDTAVPAEPDGNSNGNIQEPLPLQQTQTPLPVTAPAKAKKPSVKAGKRRMKIKLKKVKGADGYRIMYSTDKKFRKAVKKTASRKLTITIKKLKKGKTYYVKAAAYKNDVSGGKLYGKYSAAVRVKIK